MRKHFISFLHCISRGDGVRGAHHMMQFGEKQSCANPGDFEADMSIMFRKECDIYSKRGVDVDRVSHHPLRDSCRKPVILTLAAWPDPWKLQAVTKMALCCIPDSDRKRRRSTRNMCRPLHSLNELCEEACSECTGTADTMMSICAPRRS